MHSNKSDRTWEGTIGYKMNCISVDQNNAKTCSHHFYLHFCKVRERAINIFSNCM